MQLILDAAEWQLMCTQVAASLMGAALQQGMCAARLMLFVGGPSTEGAGKVVDKDLSEPIRSHEVGLSSLMPETVKPSALQNLHTRPRRCN